MKKALILLFTIFTMSAFVPLPEKNALKMPELLQNLPNELRREILRINAQSEVLNIPALAKGITTLAATNKALHKAINNPTNMLIILKSLPKAGAVLLANGLRNMPGMKSDEVQDWLKNIKLDDNTLMNNEGIINPNYIKLFENQNINLDVREKYRKQTALIAAAERGRVDVARLLLNAGADVNATDKYGSTALVSASSAGHADIVKLLIAAGANVNMKTTGTYGGETALMAASENGRTEIVRSLLEAGADSSVKDRWQRSVADLARQNIRNNHGRENDFLETIKLLEGAEKTQKEKATRK